MTMTLCYHLGGLFHRLPLLDVLHDHIVTHPLLDVLHGQLVKHLLLSILDVLHELQVEKAKKSVQQWSLLMAGATSKCICSAQLPEK